ncbi:hypothetical protein JXQ31_20115 [candidate division KSB1 bacterium]|nr:hypothetical protein [candidate division KSB1 bacterium]
MKRSIIVGSLVFLLCGTLWAGDIVFHGSAKNSIYSYESDESHTRAYQSVDLNLAALDNKLTLRSSLRALTDFNESLNDDDRFRMYSLRLGLKGLVKDRLDLVVGRQFLHPGTILGSLDGVNGQFRITPTISLQFYSGVEGNFSKSFKMYKTKDSFVNGGVIQFKKLYQSTLQLLYLNKSNESGTFWNLAGLNFDTYLVPRSLVKIQAHYNIEQEEFHRLKFDMRNTWGKSFKTILGYKMQQPQVYANSYFTIFEVDPYQQYRLGGSYDIFSDFSIEGQAQYLTIENDSAIRYLLTLQNYNGSIGMIYEDGFAGSQLGVMFDYAYDVLKNLTASVYIDYLKYRTEEIYEYDNQLGNAVRLLYHYNRQITVSVEYQWLNNRYKDSDSRFLNHISYRW